MSFWYTEAEPDEHGRRRRKARHGRILSVAVAGVLCVVFLVGVIGSVKKVPLKYIGLSYGGGPIEGEHFQGIKQPGTGLFVNGWADKLYLYPVTQRNYIISKSGHEGDRMGPDHVEAPSKDAVPVEFEVATYFKLNVDKVEKFHEQIGLKYQAWTDEGWDQMLNDSFRQQIEFALQRESRQYDAEDIYANGDVLREIQTGIAAILQENVNEVLGDEYFCGPTFVPGSDCVGFTFIVKRVTVPDDLRQRFIDIKNSAAQVEVRQNELEQARLQAKAIAELQTEGHLSPEYVYLKCVEEVEQGCRLPNFAPFVEELSIGGK